jgi:superfamily I DNA/RNA helicase
MLAVTFTNKAAGEMKERLRVLTGTSTTLPFVGTFHALGYRILSRSMAATPLSIVDEEMRKELVRDALALNGLLNKGSGIRVDDMMGWIVSVKQDIRSSKESLKDLCPQDRLAMFVQCYETYEHLLHVQHLADFEDLIFRTVQLLETKKEITNRYLGRFRDIFIDEYQDINPSQYRLIQLLAEKHANVCIIGDPDQAIYGFRGSVASCFKWFMDDFPETRAHFLTKNYRSTQTILDASVQVIQKNPDLLETGGRRAVCSGKSGDRTIHIMTMATEKAEAVAIGKTIEKMVGGIGFYSLDSGAVDGSIDRDQFSFADFAVLFRTRSQGNIIFKTLQSAGIPCQIADRKTVLDHPGITSVLSVFKLLHGMGMFTDLQAALSIFKPSLSKRVLDLLKDWTYQNELSLIDALVQTRRIPIPRMGRVRQQQLYDFTGELFGLMEETERLPVTDVLDRIFKKAGFEEKFRDDDPFNTGYTRLLQTAKDHQTDAAGFLASITLSRDTDVYDHRVEKVALTTMHAAKGLEFSVVFIAGCEDQYIPFRSSVRATDLEEERRLFYVAMTRAKKHLFLTKADSRRVNGQIEQRQLSPFVNDIDNSYKRIRGKTGKKHKEPVQEQLSLF